MIGNSERKSSKVVFIRLLCIRTDVLSDPFFLEIETGLSSKSCCVGFHAIACVMMSQNGFLSQQKARRSKTRPAISRRETINEYWVDLYAPCVSGIVLKKTASFAANKFSFSNNSFFR